MDKNNQTVIGTYDNRMMRWKSSVSCRTKGIRNRISFFTQIMRLA